MRVWLYCIIRNEARLLPYFLRHYTTFCERMEFFDDQSDDGTRELILDCPKAVLSAWPGSHGIVDDEFRDFANEKWKDARGHADWVMWVDSDEFIYHPEILSVLARYMKEGVDLPRIQGFTMISDHFPTTNRQIYDEIKTGIPDSVWSKPEVFRCNMKWDVGRHSIYSGAFQFKPSDTAELKLLHYRCLGMDWLRERHARNWSRVPDHCRARTYGENTSPGYPGNYGVAWYENMFKQLPQIPNVL